MPSIGIPIPRISTDHAGRPVTIYETGTTQAPTLATQQIPPDAEAVQGRSDVLLQLTIVNGYSTVLAIQNHVWENHHKLLTRSLEERRLAANQVLFKAFGAGNPYLYPWEELVMHQLLTLLLDEAYMARPDITQLLPVDARGNMLEACRSLLRPFPTSINRRRMLGTWLQSGALGQIWGQGK